MEHPNMISGTKFASSFTSFWQDLLPTGEAFVRKMNLEKDRFDIPLRSKVNATRRALVNEMGFVLFRLSICNGFSLDRDRYRKEELDQIYQQAWESVKASLWFVDSQVDQPDAVERKEVVEIARRLRQFFRTHHSGGVVTPSPRLPGCGFVDDCVGDVLAEEILYEVKAGERTFRLVDVKQVLVYLALNQASRSYELKEVGFLNRRMGVYYSLDVEALALRVAGESSVQLLSDIVFFVSSGGVSR